MATTFPVFVFLLNESCRGRMRPLVALALLIAACHSVTSVSTFLGLKNAVDAVDAGMIEITTGNIFFPHQIEIGAGTTVSIESDFRTTLSGQSQ